MTQGEMTKFAQLGGWTLEKNCEAWHAPGDMPDCSLATHRVELPDFPSDLAACFEVLERFCGAMAWDLSVVIGDDGDRCGIIGRHFNVCIQDPAKEDFPEGCGKTINEAIMNAVLAAGASK